MVSIRDTAVPSPSSSSPVLFHKHSVSAAYLPVSQHASHALTDHVTRSPFSCTESHSAPTSHSDRRSPFLTYRRTFFFFCTARAKREKISLYFLAACAFRGRTVRENGCQRSHWVKLPLVCVLSQPLSHTHMPAQPGFSPLHAV